MEIKSDIPVLPICDWCYATLNDDGTCPNDNCVHNYLIDLDEE